MVTYARWLFAIAAIVNLSTGLGLLVLRSRFMHAAGLDPVSGTNIALLNFTGAMIALFGYGYARIAVDPKTFRPLVHIGILGKLLAFACVTLPWLAGTISVRLPALLSIDVIFAAVFADYLRRTHAP